MQSRITELDPPRRLAFTWEGSGDVSFELEPQGDEVLLTVIHRRLPDRDTLLRSAPAGTCTSTCWSPASTGRNRTRSGTAGAACGSNTTAGCRPEDTSTRGNEP